MRHPDALLDDRIADLPHPHRDRAVEAKRIEEHVAAGRDRSIRVFVGRQLEAAAAIGRDDIELGDHQRAIERRPQRRHEQSVVATCVRAGNCAAREAAQPVRDEPFATQGAVEIAQGVAAEGQAHGRTPSIRSAIR